MNEKELILPEGWEVKEVIGNRIILKEASKTGFPKTYKDCFNVVGQNVGFAVFMSCGSEKAMEALGNLLLCRNAWWKKLGWKPDWKDDTNKFCIYTRRGDIVNTGVFHDQNIILAFPTQEVRDRFSESFRDLIEEAKELL